MTDFAAVLDLLRRGFTPDRVRRAWRDAIGGPVGARLAAHIRRTVARAVAYLRGEVVRPAPEAGPRIPHAKP